MHSIKGQAGIGHVSYSAGQPGAFAFMSALELRELVRKKSVSPVEIIQDTLARIEALQPVLNPFVTVTPELALDAALKVEAAIMSGGEIGPLAGLPLSIKDLTAVEGVRWTSGSRTAEGFVAPVDSPASERVKAAGASIVGKTTTTEFGCKPSSDSPLTGITRNPWNLAKTTGGSSAGAAASVAAGITPFALGTDGGGSIRIPSSFCGLFGIKANFGRVPLYPATATPTLAHVGPMARTVRDAALLLSTVSGYDERDPYSVAASIQDYLAACEKPPSGLRIAWSPTLGYAKPIPEVLEIATRAARVFADIGCHVETVERVFDDPIDLWLAEFYAGVGTRLKKPLSEARDLIDPTVVQLLSTALNQTIDGYYGRVFQRYDFRDRVRRFFASFDLLLTPTTPTAAFDVNRELPEEFDGVNIVEWVAYTYPFNLSGNPSASIPCGFTKEGLPVGLQIVARALHENDIFRAAAGFEAARPWAGRVPPRSGEL
jgi:aspartyl-tRNA(Asn)/glutamyl-tRNA(Gln) amidotransferase subunit A